MLFLDTNIIIRLVDTGSDMHGRVRSYLSNIDTQGITCAINLQVMSEFWVVATRPIEQNGLGWKSQDAYKVLYSIQSRYHVLTDTAEVANIWLSLVNDYSIKGKRAHDARIAAAALAHNVDAIVSFNADDFSGFGVKIISP